MNSVVVGVAAGGVAVVAAECHTPVIFKAEVERTMNIVCELNQCTKLSIANGINL